MHAAGAQEPCALEERPGALIEEIGRRPLYPADLFEAPDLVEPVVAYRNWRVIEGKLRSLYLPVFWMQPVQQAECRIGRAGGERAPEEPAHMAPADTCVCGIYASHEPDREFPTMDFRGVTGIVTLWGTIQVHPEGMRAEYARVEALALYDRWSRRQRDAVQAVAEELGVDLVPLDELEAAAPRYGRRIPGDLVVPVS